MQMKNRIAFEVEMTIEQLQEMLKYATNAQRLMAEGQVFKLEVSHNVDFTFRNLKPFKSPINDITETLMELDSGRVSNSPLE